MHLTLECRPAATFRMELAGEGADELPRGAENLIARALLRGMGDRTTDLPDVELRITNEIPLARGLGSSSAATVAGLAVGHLLAGQDAASFRSVLIREATAFEGHPDNVAPAILGDLVICGTEGDEVIALREHWPEELRFVAVIPDLRVETHRARAALPKTIPFADAVSNSARLARLLGALRASRFDLLRDALADRLHQPYRLPLATGLIETLGALRDHADARGAYLSGSGPTLMGLSDTNPAALGWAGTQAFLERGVRSTFRVLEVDRVGLVVD